MSVWQLWYSKIENDYSFFPEENESAKQLLNEDAQMIWSVEAESMEAACSARDKYLGWDNTGDD